MSVILRFAPSPTGKMHIGSARTALFNWLLARHEKGTFLLRIEDTDKERSTPENTAYIHEGMAWLGLKSDSDVLLQSTREAAHQEAAKALVANGSAYVDKEGVTRFKVPEGATEWDDLVQGHITIANTQIEDFALLRSNGTPTYHLGVVADDAFQGVTHVIRGDDHINNTPKQILLYRALGKPVPQFGHIPLILNDKGEKLSKRHGAASIQDLRDAGYLPDAIFNFLLRLSWGHGDQEIFNREEAVEFFDIHHVSKGAARFDMAKLNWMNAHYMKTLPFDEILPHLIAFLPEKDATSPAMLAQLASMWPHIAPRAQTLEEAATAALPVLTDPTQTYTPDDTVIMDEGHHALHEVYDILAPMEQFENEPIHEALKAVVDKLGGGFKAVGRPVRVALTAQTGGPDLSAIMVALGQKETLRRLKVALHHVHERGHGHH